MTARAATPEAVPADIEARPEEVVSSGTGQRIVLHGISWETYESLLADHADRRAPRFAYDEGDLEIVSPSAEHERSSEVLADIVRTLTEEWAIDIEGFGSATFKREDMQSGVEPDACFYIKNVDRARSIVNVDLSVDPLPDLVLEIDVTSPSLDKLSIYAQLGVPEVWRHDRHGAKIYALDGSVHRIVESSVALPALGVADLTRFLIERRRLKRLEWLRLVREWARLHVPK